HWDTTPGFSLRSNPGLKLANAFGVISNYSSGLLIDASSCASYHNAMLRCSGVALLCSAVMLTFVSSCFAQAPPTTPTDQVTLTKILGFENERSGDKPGGWFANPPGTIFSDDKIVHSGQWSVRIERNAQSASGVSVIGRPISWEFSGQTIELRGFLRTEDVTGYAGLWMRQDNGPAMLSLENMES